MRRKLLLLLPPMLQVGFASHAAVGDALQPACVATCLRQLLDRKSACQQSNHGLPAQMPAAPLVEAAQGKAAELAQASKDAGGCSVKRGPLRMPPLRWIVKRVRNQLKPPPPACALLPAAADAGTHQATAVADKASDAAEVTRATAAAVKEAATQAARDAVLTTGDAVQAAGWKLKEVALAAGDAEPAAGGSGGAEEAMQAAKQEAEGLLQVQ